MIPTPLLRARISQGQILPVYTELSLENLELAKQIISSFKNSKELKRAVIDRNIQSIEEEFDFRLVRGLTHILERKCVFEADTILNPSEARRLVFGEASKRKVPDSMSRAQIIQISAEKAGVTSDQLENSLWSDLDENLILKNIEDIKPQDLLKQYNLSQTQTLLFKSQWLEFTVSNNWKNIFREIKRLGLIYIVEKNSETHVRVEGPLSLLRMVDRYGTATAKLIPVIVTSKEWRITADILGKSDKRKIYRFELSSKNAKDLFPLVEYKNEPQYDSEVERRFANNFNALDSGWVVKREPEPLIAGSRVLIPDFGFEKNGLKVFLEIVGFWTPEYLESKIQKIKSLESVDLIIAVDENLACSKMKDIEKDIILFRGNIDAKNVYRQLRNREDKTLDSQIEKVMKNGLNLKGDIIKIKDIASSIGVSVEATRKAVEKMNIDNNYFKAADIFIDKDKMKTIKDKIDSLKEPTFSKVQKIFEEEGLEETSILIGALGYEVKWQGLDPSAAKIVKGAIYK